MPHRSRNHIDVTSSDGAVPALATCLESYGFVVTSTFDGPTSPREGASEVDLRTYFAPEDMQAGDTIAMARAMRTESGRPVILIHNAPLAPLRLPDDMKNVATLGRPFRMSDLLGQIRTLLHEAEDHPAPGHRRAA